MKPTLKEALIALRAWSHWHRIVGEHPKYLPGRSLLEAGFKIAPSSLKEESRRTVIRLARLGKCVACGVEVGVGSGDHIIPLSRGGPQSVENFMPLCKRCNSSKGDKDLLEWWISYGRRIEALNHDALDVYLRLRYRLASEEELDFPAPWYFSEALKQAEEMLPSNSLRKLWSSKLHKKTDALHFFI